MQKISVPEYGLKITPKAAKKLAQKLIQQISALPKPKRVPRPKTDLKESVYLKQLASSLKTTMRSLKGNDFPKDILCSQFGVSFKVGDDSVSLIPRDGKLVVTIYRNSNQYVEDALGDSRPVGYTRRQHLNKVKTVEKTLRAKCIESWNGADGTPGISFVMNIQPPESLVTAVKNYHLLEDVFSSKNNFRYEKFDKWQKANLK